MLYVGGDFAHTDVTAAYRPKACGSHRRVHAAVIVDDVDSHRESVNKFEGAAGRLSTVKSAKTRLSEPIHQAARPCGPTKSQPTPVLASSQVVSNADENECARGSSGER
ncbi:hypothetical protein I553_2414 [Mycobacterium xenopi 4042]|uniref:Uncharacterized protein n=1 Tax=Mycobacterium xenopi 4042 TaxID=1299334 RepID=X8C9V0_MYCXE|nr:hypothetical protein I553_2414 [Mycobacterium xenopi 4042]